MLLKVSIILAVVGHSLCATWQANPPPMPSEFAGQEGCYIKEINDVVPFGTVVRPIGHCYRVTCGTMLRYASCGSVAADDPNCYITEKDLSRPYPDCCPTIECVSDNQV